MVCRVHKYADGGKVISDQSMKPPERGKKPKKIVTAPAGGRQTPGAKAAAQRAKRAAKKPVKMADGGQVKKKKVQMKQRKNKAKPGMLGSGMAAKAGTALRDTRKKQMEDLGI